MTVTAMFAHNIFHTFLGLISTHIISKTSNLTTTFVLMLIIMLLSFVEWRHGLGVFLTCEEGVFTFMVMCMYTFYSFLALNSTHIISEAANLTTTSVLT